MNDIKVIASAATRVLCAGLAAIAIQPVLSEPHVFAVLTDAARAAALIGTATGAVLAVGWANHKLQTWASQRPVMPVPSAVYAAMAGMAPQLRQVVAQAQADERMTDESDAERQWHNAIVRFCAIGQSRGSFGWHTMKRSVDRPGWDAITAVLSGCEPPVIRMGSGRRPTLYAAGWDTVRLRVAIKRGWMRLPCPEQIPEVRW